MSSIDGLSAILPSQHSRSGIATCETQYTSNGSRGSGNLTDRYLERDGSDTNLGRRKSQASVTSATTSTATRSHHLAETQRSMANPITTSEYMSFKKSNEKDWSSTSVSGNEVLQKILAKYKGNEGVSASTSRPASSRGGQGMVYEEQQHMGSLNSARGENRDREKNQTRGVAHHIHQGSTGYSNYSQNQMHEDYSRDISPNRRVDQSNRSHSVDISMKLANMRPTGKRREDIQSCLFNSNYLFQQTSAQISHLSLIHI
eukprot:TRINITY_DN12311_c0_g1_i1.p1 TRINITY_DN12311_c0_g1~~TRINITY_DN12311_c0_g1_i1.p1  ORF type:complete len:259 (-),score=33.37 TRINITY_DN12311_c0_g1_i1:59-835(-)